MKSSRSQRTLFVLALVGLALVLESCAPYAGHPDPYVRSGRRSGAAIGAATGAVIGNNVKGGNSWGGAAIGGALGGVMGDAAGKRNSMYYGQGRYGAPRRYYY